MKLHPLLTRLTGIALVAASSHANQVVPGEHVRVYRAELGKPAPEFTLKDLNGSEIALRDLRGKTVVLEWFNPACPVVAECHEEGGSLHEFGNRASSRADVVWLAVNSNAPGLPGHDRSENLEKVKAWGLKYPVLQDYSGRVGRMYGAKTTPHMFVIDPRGVLIYDGAIDNAREEGAKERINYVEAALAGVRDGEVKTKRTRPYGCSVKYAEKAAVGMSAPHFVLPDSAGGEVRLADYQGHITVLEWFNPECPVVRRAHAENGTLDGAATRWASHGVKWIAINSGAPGNQGHGASKNQRAKADWKLTHPILMDEDGTVGRAYGAKTTPHMFVIDRDGAIAYMGAHDDRQGKNFVDEALSRLIAGHSVVTPVTRPYGCGVKY